MKDYRVGDDDFESLDSDELVRFVLREISVDFYLLYNHRLDLLLRKLPEGQAAFMALDVFDSEIRYSGLKCFLWNDGNDLVEVAKAMKLVGAVEYTELLESIAPILPSKEVMKSDQERRMAVDQIKWEDLNERFDKPYVELGESEVSIISRMVVYLENHRDQFILPSGIEDEDSSILNLQELDYRILMSDSENILSLKEGDFVETVQKPIVEDLVTMKQEDEKLKRGKAKPHHVKDFLSSLPTVFRELLAVNDFVHCVRSNDVLRHYRIENGGNIQRLLTPVFFLFSEWGDGLRFFEAKEHSALFEEVERSLSIQQAELVNLVETERNSQKREWGKVDLQGAEEMRDKASGTLRKKREVELKMEEVCDEFERKIALLEESDDRSLAELIRTFAKENKELFSN